MAALSLCTSHRAAEIHLLGHPAKWASKGTTPIWDEKLKYTRNKQDWVLTIEPSRIQNLNLLIFTQLTLTQEEEQRNTPVLTMNRSPWDVGMTTPGDVGLVDASN